MSVFFLHIPWLLQLQGAVYYDKMDNYSTLKTKVTWVYIQVTIDTWIIPGKHIYKVRILSFHITYFVFIKEKEQIPFLFLQWQKKTLQLKKYHYVNIFVKTYRGNGRISHEGPPPPSSTCHCLKIVEKKLVEGMAYIYVKSVILSMQSIFINTQEFVLTSAILLTEKNVNTSCLFYKRKTLLVNLEIIQVLYHIKQIIDSLLKIFSFPSKM